MMENSEIFCNSRENERKSRRTYFVDATNSTEYLSLKKLREESKETNFNRTTSNLSVLIRKMLDEAFGQLKVRVNVKKDQTNLNDFVSDVDDKSLISVKEESIASHNETDDRSSLTHESISDSVQQEKDNKLITIKEEIADSLKYFDSTECTGMYLSGLLKFDDKDIKQIKDNPLNDSETSVSRIDLNTRVNDSVDYTNFADDELSIDQRNNQNIDDSEMIINKVDSFNDVDSDEVSIASSNDRTAEFLNFLKKGNNVSMIRAADESLIMTEKDNTMLSNDTSSTDLNDSEKKKSIFVQRSPKNYHQSILLYVQPSSKRTPRLLLTSSKFAKTHNSRNNRASTSKQIDCTSCSFTKKSKSTNVQRTVKRYSNRGKPIRAPQIIFTPATPRQI